MKIFLQQLYSKIINWLQECKSYSPLKKRMCIMLACIALVFGGIVGVHFFNALIMQHYMRANQFLPVTVSVQNVSLQDWQPMIRTVGSLKAVQGVDVTTEISGLIRKICFKSGESVTAGDKLVELNADSDQEQLNSLIATAELAEITYIRNKLQYDQNAVSKSTVDASLADFKSKQAQAAAQADIVAKKTILAPFSGYLGISLINEGQYLNPGDKIVTLQYLDPIYVNFYVPQQDLPRIVVGSEVAIFVDCYPGKTFYGKITAKDPKIDLSTRNLYVEATIKNENHELLPGMFVTIEIYTGVVQRYLTLPQTAISYNTYGEIVYVVTETGKDKKGNPILTANQRFVKTGETRGDQVAILQGLKEGDKVVTSGQLKLKNGSRILINNSVLPPENISSVPVNE